MQGTIRDKLYDTDLSDAAWTIVAPLLPPTKPGGRPRTTCLRSVLDAIFYLLRTGCQWRLLPREYPPWSTVHHYVRAWTSTGTWMRLHRTLYGRARLAAGRLPCPSLVIIDGQSEDDQARRRAGLRWPQAGQGRKRHILVDTLGLIIANRVEPAGIPDQRAGGRLLGGLRPLFP